MSETKLDEQKEEQISTDIDDSLDLSELDDVTSMITDLDKSLVDIDMNLSDLEEPSNESPDEINDEIKNDSDEESPTLPDFDLPSSDEEELPDNVVSLDEASRVEEDVASDDESIDITSEIEEEEVSVEFDPLAVSQNNEDDEVSLDLPDFKNEETFSDALDVFDSFSLEHLNLALEKISVDDFLDKGDYVRAKRKITSEIKHREKDIADQEQAEMDRIARQHEEENNIVAIDALIEGADEAREQEVPQKEPSKAAKVAQAAGEKILDMTKAISAPVSEKAAAVVEKNISKDNQEKIAKAKAAVSLAIAQMRQTLAEHFLAVMKTRAFAASFLVVFEVVKTTLPAVIVGLFVVNLNQKSIAPDVLESLVSDDLNRVQIGLEMIKSNYTGNEKDRLYQLVQQKIFSDIDKSWEPTSSATLLSRANLSRSIAAVDFKDDNFDLKTIIQAKVLKNKKSIRMSYESFYNTEQTKFSRNKKFLGALTEANIFLRNKKCLSALDKYIEASSFNVNSKSVIYGQTIALNCVGEGENNGTLTQKIFKIQENKDALDLLQKTNSRLPASLSD